MRERLEKHLPKRVLDVMDNAIQENAVGAEYLKRIKPYKTLFMPEINSNGAVYTMADMLTMFRYGLHHGKEGESANPDEKRKPLFKSGDLLKHKDDARETLQIKGYKGEYYRVKTDDVKGFEYYSMDYVEEHFEKV